MSCDIFLPLEVKYTSQLCLLSLQTYNSIPNVEPDCNTIGFRNSLGKCITVTIPTGSYEIINLESMIQKLLPNHATLFQLKADGSTLKCSMTCSHDIDFTIEHNISKILGFENKVYSVNTKHDSERIVNIMKVNYIKIDCNLISGSFSNGIPSQTIHEFFPSSSPRHKIIEVPKHLVFYWFNSTSISKVNIVLRDQDNNLINLRGEPITIRLQIKHKMAIKFNSYIKRNVNKKTNSSTSKINSSRCTPIVKKLTKNNLSFLHSLKVL